MESERLGTYALCPRDAACCGSIGPAIKGNTYRIYDALVDNKTAQYSNNMIEVMLCMPQLGGIQDPVEGLQQFLCWIVEEFISKR